MNRKLILFLFLGIFLISCASAEINSSWGYKVNLTINASMINGTHTDFPVLITGDNIPSGAWLNANSDGSDIRFSDDWAGTEELAREIVSWNNVTNKTEIWVKVNLTDATQKNITMWYGYSDASDYAPSDTYGSENVWKDNQVMVYNFENVSGGLVDSTSAQRNATNYGVTNANGKIGNCGDFTTNVYADMGAYSSKLDSVEASNDFSFEGWINTTGFDATSGIFEIDLSKFLVAQGQNLGSISTIEDGIWYREYGTGISNGVWTHLAVVRSGGKPSKVYINGVLTGNTGGTGSGPGSGYYRIGDGNWGYFPGYLDHITFYETNITQGRIITEYNNQNTPELFISEGVPESVLKEGYFYSTWNTSATSTGSSNSTTIALPLESSGTYNFTVDWGDGNSDYITAYNQAEVNHTYSSEGVYNLEINGTIRGFRFNNGGDKLKITDIGQWGSLNVGNSNGYFYGCANLDASATDALNLSGTTSLRNMFLEASSFNGNINNWDVSSVTNMYAMFYGATVFNQPLNNWDVSSVTNMYAMFYGATVFNQPLNNWDVSSVTSMDQMFLRTDAFNQDLNNWDTSSVTSMGQMFMSAKAFNGNISTWNTSSVIGMASMFRSAPLFNQPLNNWDVSSVTSMGLMFNGADAFNQPLNNWDTSKVITMENMFNSADAFNGNISNWNVSSVTNMHQMFYEATVFNQPLNNWNVSSVTSMASMFYGATVFNQPLNNWDVSSVIRMDSMFMSAKAFNGNISNWNTGSVTSMASMFRSAPLFNQDLNNWDTSSVTSMDSMFYGATAFNQPLNNWDTSKVITMGNMFRSCSNFNENINNWDVSSVTDIGAMFYQATAFNQSLNNWDVSSVAGMRYMFSYTTNFNGNISNWNTSSVTDMSYMFLYASSFNQPLNDWDTSGVTSMASMFMGATDFNQDIGGWNVSSVTDMTNMLRGTTLSTANYDATLNGWATLPTLQSSVTFNGGNSQYSLRGNSSRNGTLIGTYSWTITDGGLGNAYPNVTNVLINSTGGYNDTTENLHCFTLLDDLDGDAMNVSVKWYKDDALNRTDDYNNTYADGDTFVGTLLSGNTSLTEVWKCGVQVTDGSDASSWVNSSGLTVVDALNPNATYLSPANNTNTNNNSVNFTANLTDNVELKNATLSIYNETGLYNETTFTSIAGTISSVVSVVKNIVEGTYRWFWSIFDNAGNLYTTANQTLIIDNTEPLISFNPSNPANDSGRSDYFTINVSINETYLANVTLNWNGSETIFNTSDGNLSEISTGYWIFTYNQTGLAIGQSYLYNVTAVDNATNSNVTETRLIRGNSAPSHTLISLTPSNTSYNDIDPDTFIAFNVSVYDPDDNLNSSVLQIWNSSGNLIVNQTMMNTTAYGVTTNMTANFTTNANEQNYIYRIMSSDDIPAVGYSDNFTIQSFWDCSWDITTTGTGFDLGATGGYGSQQALGNITINNTGDVEYSTDNCSVTFDRTASGSAWLKGESYSGDAQVLNFTASPYFIASGFPGGNTGLRYYYNGSEVTSLTVNASESKNLEIKGYFPTTTTTFTEYPYFPIFANINDSVDGDSNVTISMQMVVTPGAYLSTAISTPSTTSQNVYLTPGDTSLKAYIKDVVSGESNSNNTAYNVSFNWTLPSAIASLFSGNTTANYSSLNDTSARYLNLSLGLTAGNLVDLSQESYELFVYGYGYENSSGNLTLINHTDGAVISDSVNITFLCYLPSDGICVTSCGHLRDEDCSATTTTSSGSGGGGGGGASGIQTESLSSSEGLQLVRGEENQINIVFENKNNETIKNIVFEVSGDIAKYLTMYPSTLPSLAPYHKANITLYITSPTYIKTGTQELTITMRGKRGNANFVETKKVTLEIHEISGETARDLLNQSEILLDSLSDANLSYEYLTELFDNMSTEIENYNYELVKENAKVIKEQAGAALEANDVIEKLGGLIAESLEKGIDVRNSERILKLAELSLNRREFSQALERAKEAQVTYALETKGEFGKVSYYMKTYPEEISFSALMLLMISFGSYRLTRLQIIKRKIKALKEEESLLNDLIRAIQKETFKRKTMSMDEYKIAMDTYLKRLSKIIENLIGLETQRIHALKFTSQNKRIQQERAKIIEMVKDLQRDYIEKGKIEMNTYELKLHSYNKRLAEIDEKIAVLEAQKALRKLARFRFRR